MNETSQRLSLCMIVKNEEETLPRCLKSVRSLVDEIILVDTGSTDLTSSVAKDFGAQLFEYTWDDNFSSARNYSLEQASGDWILVLDADEILVCDGIEPFRQLLNDIGTEAYFLRVVSLLGPAYGFETSEDHVIRLFRNRPEYRFSGSIHEQVYPSVLNFAGTGSIKNAPLTLYHDGYLSERIQHKNKFRRNVQVIEKALKQTPRDPFLLYSLGCEYFLSGKCDEALEALQQALLLMDGGYGYLPDLVIKLGLCLYKLGHIPEMLQLFNNLHDISPLSPELLFLSGLVNLESGNLADAESNITECLKKLPRSQAYHLNIQDCQVYQALGEIYESKKSWNEAAKFYFKAIEAKPIYLYPLKKLINLYKREKPELPLEELLGFCPPENKCSILKKINWHTDEDIVLFLILGLSRDIMLCDSYVSRLLAPALLSVLNGIQPNNASIRIKAAIHLAKSVISLSSTKKIVPGAAVQTCSPILENIREILLLSKEDAVNA